MENIFKILQKPKFIIYNAKWKAYKILKKENNTDNVDKTKR